VRKGFGPKKGFSSGKSAQKGKKVPKRGLNTPKIGEVVPGKLPIGPFRIFPVL